MEGYLPLEWCIIWFLVMIPFVAVGARKIIRIIREHPEQKMTVALSGAFIFRLSSLKLPSATGSSSHPTGTGLAVVLYGVCACSVLSLIVLVFQALLLAHGGLTTLGANCVSMGVVGPIVGMFFWALFRKFRASVPVSMFFAAFFADLMTYVFTSVQLTICYHANGVMQAFADFMTTYAVTQIPLALIEGIIFAMFARYLVTSRPEIFGDESAQKPVSKKFYMACFAVIAAVLVVILAYGAANGFEFAGSDDVGSGIIMDNAEDFIQWTEGIWGSYELPGETESLLFALQAAIGAVIIGFFIGMSYARKKFDKEGPREPRPPEIRRKAVPEAKRRGSSSDQVEMDELAYSSRMVDWSPLGKLFFTLALLVVGLITDSIVVPMITFCIGLALMAYSTNMKLPPVILLAIGEAVLIMAIGCGLISILGDHSQEDLLSGKILWFDMYMTQESLNQAWLVFFRAIAGVTLMLSFASSTPIPHLAQACRKLRMPKEIVEVVVLIYRYAFLLLERMLVMLKAAKCRLGYNGPVRTMRSYAGAMVGTFMFSMELAEKSESSLACRNYQGYFPVYNMPRNISWAWVLVTLAAAAALFVFGRDLVNWNDMAGLLSPLFGW